MAALGWDERGLGGVSQERRITWATRKPLGVMIMFNLLVVA